MAKNSFSIFFRTSDWFKICIYLFFFMFN